jgi:UDP-glucose 4-epimerase
VTAIAHAVIETMGLRDVILKFTGGVRGWPGDVARVSLDMGKLQGLGWRPQYASSDEACMYGIRAIIEDLSARLG